MPNGVGPAPRRADAVDRKSTRLNSSHPSISYAVFCLKKKKVNRAKQSGLVHITNSVISRERSGLTTLLHDLTRLLTIAVTMIDIKSKHAIERAVNNE